MKKQRFYILALCCLLLCSFTACGRDKNDSNNNSVTEGTQNRNTTTPSPTITPDNDLNTQDNLGDGILDGVENVGDGILNGTEDVIDGVGNAVDDIGDGMTGDDTNNHDANGTNNANGVTR